MFPYFLSLLALATTALTASLQQVSGWGSGPSGVSMYIYVPDRVAPNPAVLVAMHYCGGSAAAMYSLTRLPSYADTHGFIIIYPQTTRDSNCWDVYSKSSLVRDAGGDSTAIIRMVNHTLARYNGDRSRVYVMGSSSGAMMTNVMAAVYPDVFQAAAVFSGVPAGCFAGAPVASPGGANQTCASGGITKSAQEWGNYARSMDPGYTGRRPRMQIWHGTADFLVVYPLLAEELKQWSNVLGVSLSMNVTGSPSSAWTKMVYGDGTQLVGYSGQGVGHPVPVNEQVMLDFFGGLTAAPPTSTTRNPGGPTSTTAVGVSTTTTTTTTTSSVPVTTLPPTGPAQSVWGQCGGSGWMGPTACMPPASCSTQNPWYAQCIPK